MPWTSHLSFRELKECYWDFFSSAADSLISTSSLLALLILRVQRLDFYCKVPLLKLFFYLYNCECVCPPVYLSVLISHSACQKVRGQLLDIRALASVGLRNRTWTVRLAQQVLSSSQPSHQLGNRLFVLSCIYLRHPSSIFFLLCVYFETVSNPGCC